MNVIINGRVFSVEQPSGAGQAGVSLVRALQKTDISLTVYGHEDAKSRLNDVNVRDTCFPVNSQLYGLFWEQLILPKIINRSSSDVYFCPTMNAPIREIEVPTVVQIHDIFRYIGDVSRLDKLRQRIRLPRMLSHADAIVTVSEFSKSEIVKHLGVPSSKIDVIYNGVDPIFLDGSESEPVNLPDEYLLYVGGTNTRKNIPVLLQYYKILKGKHNIEHDLVMVGPDPKLHHNYPIGEISSENIHITGYISKRELKFVYENADAFLFPSTYEGFGMAPLEAMACETPVVASNATSLPEVLNDSAILVSPRNEQEFCQATLELLHNRNIRKEMIQRGRERASEFTWGSVADSLVEVFQKVSELN
jgi:glycosyltransferase involved in cell wall biosynthesis